MGEMMDARDDRTFADADVAARFATWRQQETQGPAAALLALAKRLAAGAIDEAAFLHASGEVASEMVVLGVRLEHQHQLDEMPHLVAVILGAWLARSEDATLVAGVDAATFRRAMIDVTAAAAQHTDRGASPGTPPVSA